MAQLINPVNGYRGQLQSEGKQLKNHMAQNKQALSKQAEEFQRKQDA
jgi:hypothetical protein